ncbi:MAG TPA: hypothetical protein VHN20_11185 [Beijerinckiaceae bacterium]|nr:hypothetical protein [Beijerinckiaceae bacterium]
MLKRVSTLLLLTGGALGGAGLTLLIAIAAERWSYGDECVSPNPSRIETLFAPCLPKAQPNAQIADQVRPAPDVETTGSIR